MEDSTNDKLDSGDQSEISEGTEERGARWSLTPIFNKAGVGGMRPGDDEWKRAALEQQRLMKMAGELFELTDWLFHHIKSAQSLQELFDALQVYFESEMPDFMAEHKLTFESSVLMKFLDRCYEEYLDFFHENGNDPRDELLKDPRIRELERILANVAMMIRVAWNDGDWEFLEQKVPDILNVCKVDSKDMADLNCEIICDASSDEVKAVMEGITESTKAVAEDKYRRFMEGELGIAQIIEEKKIWREVENKARMALAQNPKKN